MPWIPYSRGPGEFKCQSTQTQLTGSKSLQPTWLEPRLSMRRSSASSWPRTRWDRRRWPGFRWRWARPAHPERSFRRRAIRLRTPARSSIFTCPRSRPPLGKIGEAGGKTLMPRTSIGQHGFIAHFEDSEGNRVGAARGAGTVIEPAGGRKMSLAVPIAASFRFHQRHGQAPARQYDG